MQTICYTLPGLGATADLFSRIKLPPEVKMQLVTSEHCTARTLDEYAQSLLPQIDSTRPHFYLGFSFGGAVAVELALHTRPLLTILVSGVATQHEIPFYLRYMRALGVYNLAPLIVKLPNPVIRLGAGVAFGTRDPDGLNLLISMIRSIDPDFYSCGLKALMRWKNHTVPDPILRIHGSRDLLLPAAYVPADVIMPAAGHFIVYSHGEEISAIISEAMKTRLAELGLDEPRA